MLSYTLIQHIEYILGAVCGKTARTVLRGFVSVMVHSTY